MKKIYTPKGSIEVHERKINIDEYTTKIFITLTNSFEINPFIYITIHYWIQRIQNIILNDVETSADE